MSTPLTRDLPTALHLRAGEVARVPLPSAMGAGNTWSVQLLDGGAEISADVHVGAAPEPGEPPSSTAAPETLVVRAHGACRGRLRLRLARSWTPEAPTAEHEIAVEVAEAAPPD